LGRGGTAIVYDATDLATGRKVALKRLRLEGDAASQQRITELFEREFQTLSQLAHPHIVQVYDYGIDSDGPYYTMELVAGGELSQLAPLPWRDVCAIARGVCSALSLVHSRRMVHRDLSPRNVRCSRELQAKLIDFGSLAPVGTNKFLVGTPACCAPESLHLQPLDGRTDLYGLGATLYFLLLGRHAYAAREFAALADCWLGGLRRPRELNPEIPESLDALVVELLGLEPDARPASAADVMQRLSAIDDEPLTEQQRVARAYLATPTLVGREEPLGRVHRKLERTLRRSRGETMVVRGAAGVGRSRFLDACVLDASLLGGAAVRTDADDAASGDYGVVRAIARQLMTALPLTALEAARPGLATLARVVPDVFALHVGGSLPSAPPVPMRMSWVPRSSREPEFGDDSLALRPQLQMALHAWLCALCAKRPLLIAVDDFTRIDEPSAALLSLLAHDAVEGLFLLISAETETTGRAPAAERLLYESATLVQLGNLSGEDAEQLLKSLFGDVPNLSALAYRLHGLAAGNPRDLLGLAQHLLDREVVSYEAGAWTLPAKIDDSDLPSNLAQALHARLEVLSEGARVIAIACALCADQAFLLEECELLSGRQGSSLLLDLDEAVTAQVLRCVEERYALTRPVWVAPLRTLSTPELDHTLHVRLAQVFERRGLDFRAGEHWLNAGESSRALDVLVAHARTSQHQTAKSSEAFYRYAETLPPHWFEIYQRALAACVTLERPARDEFTLRSRLAGIVPAFAITDAGNAEALIARLARDCGLEDWRALPASLPPLDRVQRAIEQAKARYAAMPERDRVLPPEEALTVLARSIVAACGRATKGLDVKYLQSLLDVSPLAPLAPALGLSAKLIEGMIARYSGRFELACQVYAEVLDRTAQPDRAGLDASYCDIVRLGVMNATDMMESSLGLGPRKEWGVRIAAHPSFHVNAVATRMLHHLFQGDINAADQCKKQVERLRIETRQLYDASALSLEIVAHVIAEDLTRVREALPQLAQLARRYEPWEAVQQFAIAAFHRIRRDPARALPVIERAASNTRAGEHLLWAQIAASHAGVLCDLGRHAEALAAATSYLAQARRAELGYNAEPIWLAYALCQANAGQPAAADTATASLERSITLGVQGLYLGLAHETRARVALLLDDHASFELHAEHCYEAYGCYRNPALLAKFRRLRHDAERRRPQPFVDADEERVTTTDGIVIAQALAECLDTHERARVALELLVGEAGARGGFLFSLGVDQAECIAGAGELSVPSELLPRMCDYLLSQVHDAPTTSSESAEQSRREWLDERGLRYTPIALSHEVSGNWVVTGAALLAFANDAPLNHPTRVASAISRHWGSEDAATLLYASEP
jgi:hypothetical protein